MTKQHQKGTKINQKNQNGTSFTVLLVEVESPPPLRPSRPVCGQSGLLAAATSRSRGLPLAVPPGLQHSHDRLCHHPITGGQQVHRVEHDLLDGVQFDGIYT